MEKKRTEERRAEMGGSPRKQTLEFLRQFARVYRCEPSLGRELGALVLN